MRCEKSRNIRSRYLRAVKDAPGMGMYERTHSSLLKAAKIGNLTAETSAEDLSGVAAGIRN